MKVKIVSNVIVFESAVTKADLETIQKYNPKALNLYDEDKNPVFCIGVAKKGSVSNIGMFFDDASRVNGNAVFTLPAVDLPRGHEVEAITDKFGVVIDMVAKIEAGIGDALAEVAKTREQIAGAITVEM